MREIDQALYDHIKNFAILMAKAPRENFKYASLFDLLLEEGFIGNPEPYTASEEAHLLKVFGYVGKAPAIKACFYNSQSISQGEDLLYAEGQVLHSILPIPIEHGFNVLPSGKVVDVTLRPVGEPNTCDPEKLLERAKRNQANAYIGLPFPVSEIRKSWAKTHMSLMLMEQRDILERIFEKGFPQSWKKGFKKYGVSPSLSGSGGHPMIKFVAEPPQREFCGGGPSEKTIGWPSLSGSSDRWEGSSAEKYSARPSPLELGGPMRNFVAMPSHRTLCVSGPSKKTRAEPSRKLSPEEQWLLEPEREDAEPDSTHSPFEGDIPPWAQSGYAGVFPLAQKVFYITAYVGSGPERLERVIKPSRTPVLGVAMPVQDVGHMPPGAQFGSDFMFHPFAAIPVRMEDLPQSSPVVAYLAALIEELGAYGKILMEHQFPDPRQTEVRLQNGRWFPVDMTTVLYGGVTYLNAYNVNRFYGGGEEGGWWYDSGDPVASVPLREEDPVTMVEWDAYLRAKVGWSSKYDRHSVLGHDDFEIRHEDYFAAPFPSENPRYQ